MATEWALRPKAALDYDFVMDSWLKSYRAAMPDVRDTDYYTGQRDAIERCAPEILIACSTERPEVILGWVALNSEALHYVYVKSSLRRCGVASALLAAIAPVTRYTHKTRCSPWITRGLSFDPYAFFKG